MPQRSLAGACLAVSISALPAATRAQEAFAGLFAHDVNIGVSAHSREAGADEQFGLRSGPWVDTGRWGSLRGYVLGSVNDEGGVDFAAAGAAWRWALPRSFYVQFGLGAAVQSGYADPFQRYPNRLDLGSRFVFEPELMLGYDLSRRWGAELGWAHVSNAGISRHNPGMDDLGARLVYRFGR
jgi:lipid A 3-O-deacylase